MDQEVPDQECLEVLVKLPRRPVGPPPTEVIEGWTEIVWFRWRQSLLCGLYLLALRLVALLVAFLLLNVDGWGHRLCPDRCKRNGYLWFLGGRRGEITVLPAAFLGCRGTRC